MSRFAREFQARRLAWSSHFGSIENLCAVRGAYGAEVKEDPMRNTVMKSLFLLVVLVLCASAASADCGKKATHEGTLKSVDAENSTITVVVGDKEIKLTLTTETKVSDAAGNAVEVGSLVGKAVKVVSEHEKIDSIKQIA
jgi:hypothetical protein